MYLRHVNLTQIDIGIGFLLNFFELEDLDWLIIVIRESDEYGLEGRVYRAG